MKKLNILTLSSFMITLYPAYAQIEQDIRGDTHLREAVAIVNTSHINFGVLEYTSFATGGTIALNTEGGLNINNVGYKHVGKPVTGGFNITSHKGEQLNKKLLWLFVPDWEKDGQMSSITLFDGPPPRDMNFGIALRRSTSERIASEAASSAASGVEKSIR